MQFLFGVSRYFETNESYSLINVTLALVGFWLLFGFWKYLVTKKSYALITVTLAFDLQFL